jgi:hypothetical protein
MNLGAIIQDADAVERSENTLFRTGCPVFTDLWSYVSDCQIHKFINQNILTLWSLIKT